MIKLLLSRRILPFTLQARSRLPSMKKPTLNIDNKKNYRVNLSVLSKVLEKVVAIHLNLHINSSKASNHYQSAYRKVISTETALTKIHNDILSSMDDGTVKGLTLLDPSAPFDTIDHPIILRRLDDWFGVTGKALDWLKSYLTGRCQRIKLCYCLFTKADIPFGVPEGSVLDPLDSINQSINQTSIAPLSPAKPGSVMRQPNQCSTAKSRKRFYMPSV